MDIHVNHTYKDVVNLTRRIYYIFNSSNIGEGRAIKFNLFCLQSISQKPLVLTVQRKQDINSWQVPLIITARKRASSQSLLKYYYWNISHTLCPELNTEDTTTMFALSTMTNQTFKFTFYITIEDLNINNAKDIVVSPSAPRYFLHTFPPNTSSLLIKVQSPHLTCASLSIQQAPCPVYDMIGIREHALYSALITTKGAATVVKSETTSFFIVLSVKPNDFDCLGALADNFPHLSRNKIFTSISVTEPITEKDFFLAMLVIIIIFTAIYIIAICSHCFYSYRMSPVHLAMLANNGSVIEDDYDYVDEDDVNEDDDTSNQRLIGKVKKGYGSVSAAENQRQRTGGAVSNGGDGNDGVSDDDDEDAFTPWYQSSIKVIDLVKPTQKNEKVYRHYFWNILTVSIFYFLPVIQLVLYFQLIALRTGDGDMCYYNFYCMYRYKDFLSFNSVFSNIGYILLGALFLIIVYTRERKYLEICSRLQGRGLPQRFDLWYAMGVGLVMEGLLSACYHICPSYNNFQFDTAFMYMIGWVSALRIFFSRHNPSYLRSHTAYLVIAFIVLIGVIGVVTGNYAFWATFTFIYIVSVLILSFNFYCIDDWSHGRNVCVKVYNQLVYQKIFTTKPKHVTRLIFLIILNVMNWSLAVFGCIFSPDNFASYLLAIIISNFLLYFFVYLVMKILHREKFYFYSILFIIVSFILWPLSLYFFYKKLAAWELTPAMSRMNNEDCIWMGFYDYHDIWHFLSSLSLFFSFLVILTMDDALWEVPRKKIRVF